MIMQLCSQRASSTVSKVFSTAFFHGQTCCIECSPASTLWFTKVVCTLCIQHSQSLSVFNTQYFRHSLNHPFIAFGVISHINTRFNNPSLAFGFFQYSKLSLNLIHSETTFHLLLRSLCQAGFHDSAKLVYEYMKADGFLPNDAVLEFLVLSFAKSGNYRIAQEILTAKAESCNEMETISSFVYNKFLSLLVARNQVDEAVAFFGDHMLRLRSFSPDNCSFNIVVRGLCQLGKVEKAFEFFDVMRSFGCHPDIIMYNTLINGLCRVGNIDRALKLLKEVQTQCAFAPDVVTYTSVISGYCKLGKMEDAVTFFDEMIARGIRPSLFSFNVIIDGFGKKGELPLALKMFERMINSGFHPDVVSFTSLIDDHCRVGEVDQCLKLWDEMNERKVSPNVYTFSVVINSLCRENRLNEARSILNQLNWREDIIPPPFVYNPLIDGFCKSGNLDEANAIVGEMEAKGCIHDKMTFTILILGHCMKGRMFEAIGIYDKMLLLGCAPDTITVSSLVSCLRKAGMAHEACEIERNASNTVQKGLSPPQRTESLRPL